MIPKGIVAYIESNENDSEFFKGPQDKSLLNEEERTCRLRTGMNGVRRKISLQNNNFTRKLSQTGNGIDSHPDHPMQRGRGEGGSAKTRNPIGHRHS